MPIMNPTVIGPTQTIIGKNPPRQWKFARSITNSGSAIAVDPYDIVTSTFPPQVTSFINSGTAAFPFAFRTGGFLNQIMRLACTGANNDTFTITLLGTDERQGDGGKVLATPNELYPKAVTLASLACTLGQELTPAATWHPIFPGRVESAATAWRSVDTIAVATGTTGTPDLVLNNPFDSGGDQRESMFEFSTSCGIIIPLITAVSGTTRVDICFAQES